ncbi:MAG: hypothetical protein HQ485_05735 [Acidobacteria bacterium]|nr:hypothetical protein [Acidobacteriota bacterium]
MSVHEAIRRWRALPPEEQRRQMLALIPEKVARSMAFEGEPVPPEWLEEQRLGVMSQGKRTRSAKSKSTAQE